MLKLIIEDDEGRKTVVPFVREEITIGRQEGNTIRLTERNVSRRHARLLRQNGHVMVEDLGSSNGTRINGERISGQSSVKDGDLIQIGDYDLALQSDAAASTARMRPAPAAEEPSDGDASTSDSESETEAENPVHEEDGASANGAAPGDARRHSTAIIRMDQVEGNRNRKIEEIDAEEAPRLVVVSSEFKGQEYACIRTEMRIGRTEDNDIVIDHRSLSRTHAKVVREGNGEWRILDMQSANGMTVNGESYAQASLNNGDVVELGHVKLKFVAAGEAAGETASGGRSKLPLVVAAAVLGLGGIGAAIFFISKQGADQPTKPPEITQQEPAQPTEPVQPPDTPPPSETKQPGEQPDTATAEKARQLEERLESVKKALDDGEPGVAERNLDPLRQQGKLPPEAQELAERIEVEKKFKQALEDAQAAFRDKKYDEAKSRLDAAEGSESSVLRQKRDALRAEVDEALKAQAKVDPAKPPTPPGKPPAAVANAEQEAQDAHRSAAELLRAKQYNEALTMASKCVDLAPKNADCQMLLGASYAGLNNYEKAVEYYKKFLELAPDHRLAPKVRQALENQPKGK